MNSLLDISTFVFRFTKTKRVQKPRGRKMAKLWFFHKTALFSTNRSMDLENKFETKHRRRNGTRGRRSIRPVRDTPPPPVRARRETWKNRSSRSILAVGVPTRVTVAPCPRRVIIVVTTHRSTRRVRGTDDSRPAKRLPTTRWRLIGRNGNDNSRAVIVRRTWLWQRADARPAGQD